ncbi:MAG: PCYCGC motif-containing (lipo)protein [Ramlibacter sp.]
MAVAAILLAAAGLVWLSTWLMPAHHAAESVSTRTGAATTTTAQWHPGILRADGLRIVVSGRSDAAQVLDPRLFSQGEVIHSYRVARKIPGLLNQLYCWCGCEDRGVHRSNLQCFEDDMAEDCTVCRGTAEIADDMNAKGITDAAKIQAMVDAVWGPK